MSVGDTRTEKARNLLTVMKHPSPLDDATRLRMKRQGRRDTRPEISLRQELHRRGLRYRVDVKPLAGMRSRADILFRPSRVAVFVDGCFWHKCPEHFVAPKNNSSWWQEKLLDNQVRDARVDATLRDAGWLPIRVWEHEDPNEAADMIELAVRERRR